MSCRNLQKQRTEPREGKRQKFSYGAVNCASLSVSLLILGFHRERERERERERIKGANI